MLKYYSSSPKEIQQKLHKTIESNSQYFNFENGAPSLEFQQDMLKYGHAYHASPTQVKVRFSEWYCIRYMYQNH